MKPYTKTHQVIGRLGIGNLSSVTSVQLRKGELSLFRRALPPRAIKIVDDPNVSLINECKVYILCRDTVKDINKASSKEINDLIKDVLHKRSTYHPANKFQIDRSWFGDIRSTWHNLWRIKNPTLRAIRLKVLYKDIWCNDKRLKLGISSDNKCIKCGEPETVIHQLFTCINAKRIWDIGSKITGLTDFSINEQDHSTFSKQIEVSQHIPIEIIKSVIFKLLIQINRSNDLNETEIRRIILYWMNIEYLVLSKTLKNNRSQLAFLKQMMSNLEI